MGISAGQSTFPLLETLLEAFRVEAPRLEAKRVAGAARDDEAVLERPAQLRDVILDDLGGGRGCLLAPELVDETVGRNSLVRVEDQQGEERALPPARERNRPVP